MCSASKTTVKNFAEMLGYKPDSRNKWLHFTREQVEKIAQVNQLTLRMHYKGIEKLIAEGPDRIVPTLDHFQLAVPRFQGGLTN